MCCCGYRRVRRDEEPRARRYHAAMEILKDRPARGEIDEAEFEEKAMPVYQYECTPCQVETTRLLRSARNVGAQ